MTLCQLSRAGLPPREAPASRAHWSHRTGRFTTLGQLLGDAQEGVGTRWAGPQEADRVCLGSLGCSTACWRHTPCVSPQEARWTFLPCFLFSLPSCAGQRRCLEKTPLKPALWEVTLNVAWGSCDTLARTQRWALNPPGLSPRALCVNSFPSPKTPPMGPELIQQIFAEHLLSAKCCSMHGEDISKQSTQSPGPVNLTS